MFKQIEESLRLLKRDKKSIQRSLQKETEGKEEIINHYKILNEKEIILKNILRESFLLKKCEKREIYSSLSYLQKTIKKGS